jgi:hypothetical protein
MVCGATMTEGLKTIEGQVASIDLQKRVMAIENRDGVIFYSVTWVQPHDNKVAKLKVGYYVKPTVEVKTDDSGRLIDLPYSQRPDDWPKKASHGGFGGKTYVPKNDKPILYESILKSLCDVASPDDFQNQTYEQKMDRIAAQAKKIYQDVVQLVGA